MYTLDEIDAMTLQQALQVADDWDGQVHNCSVPRRHPPRFRVRQLHELRAQVASLERTLAGLRNARPRTSTAGETAALRRECDAIVARQRRARLEAQTLNLQYRRLCHIAQRDGLKMARLGRRLKALELSLPPCVEDPYRDVAVLCIDPPQQLHRLQQIQQDAKRLLAPRPHAPEWTGELLSLRDVSMSNGAVEVVFECAWIVPFSIEDVAEGVWLQTTRVATGYDAPTQWQDMYADGPAMVSQFVYAPADDIVKIGQIATRRDVATDGSVQLVSTIDVQAMQGGECVGQFQSDVWIHVTAVSTNAKAPLTQIHWCRRRRVHASHLNRWSHNAVPGPIQAHEDALLQRNKQALENTLVVKSAQRRKVETEPETVATPAAFW